MNGYFVEEGPYLAHYGVLGMKWGVRRYQNYDGSYTKEGLRRYRESEAAYNKADTRVKKAKANYDKNNNQSKIELANARVQRRRAKNQLKNDYKQLSKDKKGDKGKELYGKGQSITGNDARRGLASLATGAAMGLAFSKYSKYLTKSPNTLSTVKLGKNYFVVKPEVLTAAVVGGVLALDAAYQVKKLNDNSKLRAYYSHTRTPRRDSKKRTMFQQVDAVSNNVLGEKRKRNE